MGATRQSIWATQKLEGTNDAVSGVKVNAFVRDGSGFSEAITGSDGSFTLQVSAGRWMVMPFFDQDDSYALDQQPQEVSVSSGGTAGPINFLVKSASATIRGALVDESGNPVSVYGYAFAQTAGGGMFGPGGLGGPIERGTFSFKVPAGSYVVNAGLAPGSSYSPGDGTSVTIANSETKNITVSVKTNNATITGSIIDESGAAISSSVTGQMFVFAISAGLQGHTFQDGTISGNTYTIRVADGDWALGYFIDPSAGYMSEPPDPSMRLSVSAGGTATKNITLKTANSTITGTVYQPGGTTPATSSLPTKKGDKPIWYGYEFSAVDSNGQTITSFSSSITITFPYSDSQLSKLGITADDLIPSYWDETSGAWKKVSNVTIDTTNKTVTINIDHFTDFALTANAITITTGTTGSVSGTSTATTTAQGAGHPEILANQGGLIQKHPLVAIVEEGTLPWDSYLSLSVNQKRHPLHIGAMWQVSDIYEVWFRSFFNDAKILYPNKPSILAIRYEKSQLGRLPENSLKLAYSADEGKTWKILPTSVLDIRNKTVAALTKKGGLYMLVAGYGYYSPFSLNDFLSLKNYFFL